MLKFFLSRLGPAGKPIAIGFTVLILSNAVVWTRRALDDSCYPISHFKNTLRFPCDEGSEFDKSVAAYLEEHPNLEVAGIKVPSVMPAESDPFGYLVSFREKRRKGAP